MSKNINIEDEYQEQYSDDSLYNINSWGADFSFSEIIRRYNSGDIIKPELQRKYVWDKKSASRFIDSILLGLPVPSIFLAKMEDESLLIIDGYQRIMTVHDFFNGVFTDTKERFSLTNSEIINKKWRGKTFKELSIVEQRRIQNFLIHAIIFQQIQPNNDTGMYQIFERINTTGITLKPQEIRNCVYYGEFNNFLSRLNNNENWRSILGADKADSRMADIELILRFFAMRQLFQDIQDNKQMPSQIILNKYLNEYMGKNQNIQPNEQQILEETFNKTVSFYNDTLQQDSFRNISNNGNSFTNKINPAIFDALMVAFSFFDDNIIKNCDIAEYKNKYIRLLQHEQFILSIKERTTKIENIKTRINLAKQILFE